MKKIDVIKASSKIEFTPISNREKMRGREHLEYYAKKNNETTSESKKTLLEKKLERRKLP